MLVVELLSVTDLSGTRAPRASLSFLKHIVCQIQENLLPYSVMLYVRTERYASLIPLIRILIILTPSRQLQGTSNCSFKWRSVLQRVLLPPIRSCI
jgi:hypothetical protein